MSQDSLTARYRPQTFAQVAGQDSVKRILSRAAALGRVAPAYLFSGTRGVGKTTLARIFAKALNCQNGPGPEPCNQCPICRQITLGAAVDVVEIDGASNTGVDNVRRLKEDVGYAPLECRYKVIIIDEAHMLSKAAFNALLKTLEEPPGHVTFIMATTEPEKFPQTIISRCQHFVFKRLPQSGLAAHLNGVLGQEEVEAEASAVNLIARRGAGSVRDSMSLLAQVLALGSGTLTLADVREVLGLAGQEVFVRLAQCVQNRDLLGLHGLLTEILDQGVDLGFFLRELAASWRNLFLLRQLGEGARTVIDLPAEELDIWSGLAPQFELSHLHAAWQMTLDSQRKILTSMEPALALELLLLNLASLPDLLAVGAPSAGGQAARQTPAARRPASPPSPQGFRPGGREQTGPAAGARASAASPLPGVASGPASSLADPAGAPLPARPSATTPTTGSSPARPTAAGMSEPGTTAGLSAQVQPESSTLREKQAGFEAPETGPMTPPVGPRTWDGFVSHCQKAPDKGRPVLGLDKARGQLRGEELVISTPHAFLSQRLGEMLPRLAELARSFYGHFVQVRIEAVAQEERKTRTELRQMATADPAVREAQEIFQARIMEVRPLMNANAKESDI